MSEKVLTSGLEDYIEVISNYIKKYDKVRAIDISRELNVSRASVSEALKRLADMGLINYGKYGIISITDTGEKAACQVVEKHELLYKFFNELLGIEAQEAAENACKIEHIISKNALEQLKKLVIYSSEHPEIRVQIDKMPGKSTD